MDYKAESLKLHETHKGKIEVISKVKLENKDDLSIAYTPGVAEPCLRIKENVNDSYKYTSRGNIVAVITDGSAVLGLGNIGPYAAMPVMEGKSILLKEFGKIDSIPVCLDTQDPDEIIRTCKILAPTFGAINLEDISAPRCVTIERKLKEELDIPVFHDDQHGTAIIVGAALINCLRLTKKKASDIKVVMSGMGAAGSSIARMLKKIGVAKVYATNSKGVDSPESGDGTLASALIGANMFVGVSAPGLVTKDMVKTMAKDPFIFALANPTPEIMPNDAKEAGAYIVGTGRSDFPNQINNVLAFPGIFRGALDAHATKITEEMKVAASYAIANVIADNELTPDYIVPSPFDKRVVEAVSKAVANKAIEQGVIRK